LRSKTAQTALSKKEGLRYVDDPLVRRGTHGWGIQLSLQKKEAATTRKGRIERDEGVSGFLNPAFATHHSGGAQ